MTESHLNPRTVPRVSVVVLNFNGSEVLGPCFEALERQTFSDFEVILVDNGSQDGSLERICSRSWKFPLLVLVNSENVGFAAGNNQGIRASRGEFVATLNNDTEVEKEWLAELVRSAERDRAIGMVASQIRLWGDRDRLDSAGLSIYADGLAKQRGRWQGAAQFSAEEDVLMPSACAGLYRRNLLEELNGFDEDFFAYCEDTDLGLRARARGWRAVYAPRAIVYHRYSHTTGPYTLHKVFLVERNRIWTAVKNLPAPQLLFSILATAWRYLHHFGALISARGSSGALAKEEGWSTWKLPVILIKAYAEALRALPRMWKKRQENLRNRKITPESFQQLLRQHRISAKELTWLE